MLNISFTDAQGVTHAAAVMRIRVAYHSVHGQTNYQCQADGSYATSGSSGEQVNYQAEYWPDLAKFNAGRKPYLFVDALGSESFGFDKASYPGVDVIESCENHLQNVVLPGLSG